MKDEIKEILEDIKEIYYFKPLLDYITNLQEENEKFKDYAKNYLKSKIDRKNEELELVKTKFIEEHNKCLDYKSRNEKSIEYIKNNICGGSISNANNILNILQGEDNETR